MSKSVLISIQPKWCELIASGEKTGKIIKSKPKLNTPFKAYIYCTTKGDALAIPCLNLPRYTIHRKNNGTIKGRRMTMKERVQSDYSYANGKVIGEFVCDKISEIRVFENGNVQDFFFDNLSNTCLTYDEISEYISRDGIGYNWHISNLKIYKRPKELSEFFYACNKPKSTICSDCVAREENKCKSIIRPPQSWCYVAECEEIDEKK